MIYPLAKRKKDRLGVRQEESRESPRHRKFVRGFVCIASNKASAECRGGIEFCHVRSGLPLGEQAGVSEKPHDAFGFPACSFHHARQHSIGEKSFEREYGVKLLDTALKLARLSPDPVVKAKAQSVEMR